MSKILVTGGAGFLGSHLCDTLIDKGEQVICLDNLYTGSKENIKHLLSKKSFVFVEQDVTDYFETEVDAIYNLACPASPVHYQLNPIQTMKTNVCGMMNMLELAKKNNAYILQASTSEIYGDPEVHPQPESYRGRVNPIGIRACYDEGKRAAETLCFDYHRMYHVPIKLMRIFNTYGPRMNKDDGRVVSNFITQALRGEDITIYGDGSQTRSFCYVDDLICGMTALMNSSLSFTGPCNIGDSQEFTVLQLAKMVIAMTSTKSKIIYKQLPSDDPARRKPDITLAQKELNWQANFSIEEGLQKTVDYFLNCSL